MLANYFNLLCRGTAVSLGAWALAGTVSLLLGTVLGVLSARQLRFTKLRRLIRLYTFIMKGVPAYVQILIAYFVVPALIGLNLPGFLAATLALAVCSSGYVTEIIRGGINAIYVGQWEAGRVLGLTNSATIRYVILPQAYRHILPALLGELEQLLKSTALLATIGVTELTRTGMNIISRELNPVPVYLTIAAIYLVLSALLNLLAFKLEQRLQVGH
ncbi:MAG TPA: amino acid ABC transporter permease [Candidatus Babeliales bacterium]|nr:amino acid ABC transporter permease [Candidatus Babeliales bacterium]